MDALEQNIREFITKELMGGENKDFDRNLSLLDSGAIDSISLFRLISYLEETHHVRVPDQDLLAENFQTLDHIVKYVKTRAGSGEGHV